MQHKYLPLMNEGYPDVGNRIETLIEQEKRISKTLKKAKEAAETLKESFDQGMILDMDAAIDALKHHGLKEKLGLATIALNMLNMEGYIEAYLPPGQQKLEPYPAPRSWRKKENEVYPDVSSTKDLSQETCANCGVTLPHPAERGVFASLIPDGKGNMICSNCAYEECYRNDKYPVICIEHLEKNETGNLQRGDKYYIPVYTNTDDAVNAISDELDAFEDYPDLMILVSMEMMTQQEIDDMPEFEGW